MRSILQKFFFLSLAALPARGSELTIRWSDNGGRNTVAIRDRADLERMALLSCPSRPGTSSWADGLSYFYCPIMVDQFAGMFDRMQEALRDETSSLRFLLSLGKKQRYTGVFAKGGVTSARIDLSRFLLSHDILPYYSPYANDFEGGIYHEISHLLFQERAYDLGPGQIPDLAPQIRATMQILRKGNHPDIKDVAGTTGPAVALDEGLADAVAVSLLGKNAASVESMMIQKYLFLGKKTIPCQDFDSREVVVAAIFNQYIGDQRDRIRKALSAVNPKSSASYTSLKGELLRLYPEEAQPLQAVESQVLPDSCFPARPTATAKPSPSPTLKSLESAAGAEPGCFDGSLKE